MRRRPPRGSVLVEAALALPLLLVALALALVCGQCAWYGTVLDKAASNAARYLSTVPLEWLQDSERRTAVLQAAQELVAGTLSGAGIAQARTDVKFDCGLLACQDMNSSYIPASVRVSAVLYLDASAQPLAGGADLVLQAEVKVGRVN